MDLEATRILVEVLRKRGHNVTFNENPSDKELERINKLIKKTKEIRGE